jgi:type II secretory pathway component PulK
MKVMLQVFATLKSKKTNEDVRQVIKRRRYNITNEGEIPNFLNQMATDVEHQAEVMEVSESGLVTTQIDKLKFN